MSNSLRRVLAQDDTIIFVGSGISRWSGLPSWEGLVGELADYLEENDIDATLVRQEATARDLLQAASYGFLKLTPPQIAVFMRNACRSGSALPHAIHHAIMMLGPSCFITTNYDDLLEQAYRHHRPPPSEPHIVLNTQLLEQAEIIHAQARRFIFKPHGDARHAESIVLTREQYRMLLPEGPLSATLNTFKTLLQSRPVLFLGFGLRDPDFLLLRDLLANIYRGGMRDHYAIVADPVRDQEDYWRTHYGIHLVGYTTADQGRDHSGLLTLLDQLRPAPAQPCTPIALDVTNPTAILALARYAAGCLTPSTSERFVIRVSTIDTDNSFSREPAAYNHWPVERLLHEGPSQFILLGEPGAGKSFAIREAVNAAASNLQDACLRGELHAGMRIPIPLDLKLYDGDLEGMISSKFPDGLSLDRLHSVFPVTLYVDGYNEMPRAFRENGSLDRQLDALLEAKPGLGLVIGSRTTDGLERFEVPVCRLSEITAEEVERRLAMTGATLPTTHGQDIFAILQRPFYFRLLERAVMSLDEVQTPGDLYAQFIRSIETRFTEAFGAEIPLKAALQRHAYATLEQGSEAFLVNDLEAAILAASPQLAPAQIELIVNWLASEEVIIPALGQRAAFVHQSVTEFLAACELKIQIEENIETISKIINMRRWDNAIFLTIGMLNDRLAYSLLNEIISKDVTFALNSGRFVQHGSEQIVGQLLEIIAKLQNTAFDYEAKYAFGRLPFAASHEPALRRILLIPMLRGEAFSGLAKALGTSVKHEIIDCLFAEGGSWTTREIGAALGHLIEPSDLSILVDRLALADIQSLDIDGGITNYQVSAIAVAARNLSSEDIRLHIFGRLNTLTPSGQRIISTLVCDIFSDKKSIDGLNMLISVARSRLSTSLFSLYLNVRFEPELQECFFASFDDEFFHTIIHYINHGDRWSVELLETCCINEAIRNRVMVEAERTSGIRRHLLEYCATRQPADLFTALDTWLTRGRAVEELSLLQSIDFPDLNWSGRHDLLIALLARHDSELARLVLGGSCPPDFVGLDNINLGDVEPWLNWLIELEYKADIDEAPIDHDTQWVAMQIAALLGRSSAPDNKDQLINLLESGDYIQKYKISTRILSYIEGISLEDLSRPMIEFLKSLIIIGEGRDEFHPHIFALIADEAFFREEIFPLSSENNQAYDVVATIARQVGKRLGIRLALPPISTQAAGHTD